MRSMKYNISNRPLFVFCLLLFISCSLLFSACGYQMVGSKLLPFNSVIIKPVVNRTYEPKLEDYMHDALSREFLSQGIMVVADGNGAVLDVSINRFELSAIASVDDKVQEQAISMTYDVSIEEGGRVKEFDSLQLPVRITFHSSGTVSESVIEKQRAIERSCSEIARDIISKIILRYAE